jgi:hypothetical protein
MLIGRIGDSQSFIIGEAISLVAEENGILQLSMNDHPGYFENNTCSLQVTVLVKG